MVRRIIDKIIKDFGGFRNYLKTLFIGIFLVIAIGFIISFFLKTNLRKEKLFYNFAGSEIPTFESMVDDTSYRRKETSSSGHNYTYNLSAGATNIDAQKAIDTYIDGLLEYGCSLVVRSDRYATLDYVNTESPKKSQKTKKTSFSNYEIIIDSSIIEIVIGSELIDNQFCITVRLIRKETIQASKF